MFHTVFIILKSQKTASLFMGDWRLFVYLPIINWLFKGNFSGLQNYEQDALLLDELR